MNTKAVLYQTDHIRCYDGSGQEIGCAGTGQDGDIRAGNPWPEPRFEERAAVVKDLLSGLMWTKKATPAEHPQTWGEASEYVDRLNTTCRYGPGYGDHMMGYGPYGNGNLSPQDAAKMEQSQQKFLNDTSDLRNSIQEKRFALNQELQQANLDRDKVTNLQKELSQLESQFDQIAPEHQLDLRKNFPENALSIGYGRGRYCW